MTIVPPPSPNSGDQRQAEFRLHPELPLEWMASECAAAGDWASVYTPICHTHLPYVYGYGDGR